MNWHQMLIYRENFLISSVAMVIWVCVYIGFIEVLFSNIQQIAGWDKGGMIVILSSYYMITGFANVFFRESFESFGDTMRRGKIDKHITKPISLQVACFLENIRIDQMVTPVMAVFLLNYGMNLSNMSFGLIPASIWLLIISFSIIFYYHFLLLVASITFYMEKSETIGSIMWNLSQIGRYPRQIYTGVGKIFFTFIFPIAVATTLPSEIILKKGEINIILQFIATVIIFSLITQFLFNRGLKKYSSAN